MFDFSATDPVASGIIASATEGSGNPMVWAQVEPLPVFRQLKYYYSMCPFRKLGVIVYGDETISGVPDIVYASKNSPVRRTNSWMPTIAWWQSGYPKWLLRALTPSI